MGGGGEGNFSLPVNALFDASALFTLFFFLFVVVIVVVVVAVFVFCLRNSPVSL